MSIRNKALLVGAALVVAAIMAIPALAQMSPVADKMRMKALHDQIVQTPIKQRTTDNLHFKAIVNEYRAAQARVIAVEGPPQPTARIIPPEQIPMAIRMRIAAAHQRMLDQQTKSLAKGAAR